MRRGGVFPSNLVKIEREVEKYRASNSYFKNNVNSFIESNSLVDITDEEFKAILRKIKDNAARKTKRCWHPNQGDECLNKNGKIEITNAHSIQRNRILKSIEEDGHVMTFNRERSDFSGSLVGKKIASTFMGFCNKHDSIFSPIETIEYQKSKEQHFLYAYRSFVVASHIKLVSDLFMDYGNQSSKDIKENKKIFDEAIVNQNYNILDTDIIELPTFYPIAVSSAFYLDFDFTGNEIPHSDSRMEYVYLTVFPKENRTYVLISYLSKDKHLYGNIAKQIRSRNNIKSDITMLIGAHCENVYFNPTYFDTFILKYKDDLSKLLQAQFNYAQFDNTGNKISETSLTPPNYLDNEMRIIFFGY